MDLKWQLDPFQRYLPIIHQVVLLLVAKATRSEMQAARRARVCVVSALHAAPGSLTVRVI